MGTGHARGSAVRDPNPWDAGSAKVFAAAAEGGKLASLADLTSIVGWLSGRGSE